MHVPYGLFDKLLSGTRYMYTVDNKILVRQQSCLNDFVVLYLHVYNTMSLI